MGHKTLVGGTAYDISGGKVLVGGTAYDIKKGRTLVGGTGYDISFMPAIGTPLNDLTWEQIRAISDAGLADDYFDVGDTKTIIINGTVGATTFSSLEIDVLIIGIDHNSSVEGANKIHFQIGKINGVDVCLVDSKYNTTASASGYFTMNTNLNSDGGWEASYMRNTLLGSASNPTSPTANSLLAALPYDLRAVMKPITKYTDNTGGGNSGSNAALVTATTDYLPLLSEFEALGKSTYANGAEKNYQKQYDYFVAGNSAKKYKHNATTSSAWQWARSPYGNDDYKFCYYASSGSTAYSNTSCGIAPIFAV